jgi:hypothetical protein
LIGVILLISAVYSLPNKETQTNILSQTGFPTGIPSPAANVTIYSCDFESGFIGFPIVEPLWHLSNSSSNVSNYAYLSNQAAWFGNDSTGTFNTGVGVNGSMQLPTLDFSGHPAFYLEFMHRRQGEQAAAYDLSYIEYLNGSGVWVPTYKEYLTVLDWGRVVVNLTSLAGNNSVQLRFRFDSVDSVSNDFFGWLVDNIRIYTESVPSLTAPTNPYVNPITSTNGEFTLYWDIVPEASNYLIYMSQTGVFDYFNDLPYGSTTNTFLSGFFDISGYYYFTILAVNGPLRSPPSTIVTLYVEIPTNLSPQLSSPNDLYYTQGSNGNYIQWEIIDYDYNPTAAYYEVYLDTEMTYYGTWGGPSSIVLYFDNLPIGTHTAVFYAYDGLGGMSSDQVNIFVNPGQNSLSITHPQDITFTVGASGKNIRWIVTGYDTNDPTYQIFVNGISQASGSWTSGQYINFNVSGLPIGNHLVEIYAYDGYGNTVIDTVYVSVTAPTTPTSSSSSSSSSTGTSGTSQTGTTRTGTTNSQSSIPSDFTNPFSAQIPGYPLIALGFFGIFTVLLVMKRRKEF